MEVLLCATLLPYTAMLLWSLEIGADLPHALPPLWTLGIAQHLGAMPVLGGVCPSAIIAVCGITAIPVSLMPVAVLSPAFVSPDATVRGLMTLFLQVATRMVAFVAVAHSLTTALSAICPLSLRKLVSP